MTNELPSQRFAPHGDDGALASLRFLTMTGEDREKAMARAVSIINERHAIQPVTAERIHVHAATMSTDQLDSYYSRMHQSSLTNFARDASEGRAFIHSHNTRNLPLGHTFEGSYDDQGDKRTASAGLYMLRGSTLSGVSTDELSQAIYAGTVRDVSVGFSGGKSLCDICGNDLRDYENCPHIPGSPRKCPTGQVCTYTIHGAQLRELSAVYEGATPGSMFSRVALLKTERAATGGDLSPREVVTLEERYAMPLRAERSYVSIPATKPQSTERTHEMKAKEMLDHFIVRSGAHLQEETRKSLETLRASLSDDSTDCAPVMAEISRALLAGHENRELLAQFRTAGVPDVATAQQLARDGKDGRDYRAALIKDALEAGVRAQADGFPKEMYQRILSEPGRSLDEIRSLKDGWEKQATERLSALDDEGKPTGAGGRQTNPIHGFEERSGDEPPVSTGTPNNYKTRGRR